MKQIRLFTKVILALSIGFAFNACSNDDFSELDNNEAVTGTTKHTMKMNFIGNVVGYDQQGQSSTRAASTDWNDGDTIYISFYNGSNIVPGIALYNSKSGWTVTYDGTLATGSNLKCEARYFVNTAYSSSSLVSLDINTAIYEDLKATYAYSDGTLTVGATLSPKSGRMRFAGTAGQSILIYPQGISVYTSFSPANNTLYSTSNPQGLFLLTVDEDGYTPYFYGLSNSSWSVGVVGSDCAFTRTCSAEMLKAGASGYMSIPTESSHSNWRGGLYVTASGVEFKMVPVPGHADGYFLMAETETTEALYNSVNGTASKSQLPVDDISYPSITSFITTLYGKTGLYFSLPTADQWMYAAKGGEKSQGFTYAGSNIADDVAWYSGNCTSKQNVKTKSPNELGIYDMSGNVGEFVSTMLTLYNGDHPYIYGGGYCSDMSNITKTSNANSYDYSAAGYDFYGSYRQYTSSYCHAAGVGFRLILQ